MAAGSWPWRHGRTVTVIVHGIDDRTQDRVADPDRSAIVEGCAFDPGTTNATAVAGVTVTQQPRLFGPYELDVEVRATTVLIDGDEWEVDGAVLRWRNDLTGREACSEIPLTRTRGAR